MTRFSMIAPALAAAMCLAGPLAAQQTKVGIVNIQGAIFGTKDGQKALQELQKRFEPKKDELAKKQQEIEQLKAQYAKGSSVMSADQRDKLTREIDAKTKTLNRDTEDAQAELDAENQKLMQELGQRMMAVIDKYAKDNGYAMILDVSSQANQVLYAANGIDITQDAVKLYDQNAPAAGTAAPSAPGTVKPLPSPIAPAPKKK